MLVPNSHRDICTVNGLPRITKSLGKWSRWVERSLCLGGYKAQVGRKPIITPEARESSSMPTAASVASARQDGEKDGEDAGAIKLLNTWLATDSFVQARTVSIMKGSLSQKLEFRRPNSELRPG